MKIGDYVRTNNGLIFKIVGGNKEFLIPLDLVEKVEDSD